MTSLFTPPLFFTYSSSDGTSAPSTGEHIQVQILKVNSTSSLYIKLMRMWVWDFRCGLPRNPVLCLHITKGRLCIKIKDKEMLLEMLKGRLSISAGNKEPPEKVQCIIWQHQRLRFRPKKVAQIKRGIRRDKLGWEDIECIRRLVTLVKRSAGESREKQKC